MTRLSGYGQRHVERLLWVLQHPTPYNIYLLNSLNALLDVRSEAVYRFDTLPNHPWKKLPSRGFQHRTVDPEGGTDEKLQRVCASDARTLPIFTGWRDRTILPALLRRLTARLPYAFWSDTPKLGRSLPRRLLNSAQLFFVNRSVGLLATGEPAMHSYERMGVPRASMSNLPFIVDPGHFATAREIRARRRAGGEGAVCFVLPARLIDSLKGQRVAIDALAVATAASGRRMKLVIAGVGPDKAMLQRHAAERGVGHLVEFAGWVEYDSLPTVLGNADALVLPSWWDPFPVAVIEAMAAGLPVLGSAACGSVRERVRDNVNGFTHQPGDSSQLAAHMTRLTDDDAALQATSAAAFETSTVWGAPAAAKTVSDFLRRVVAS